MADLFPQLLQSILSLQEAVISIPSTADYGTGRPSRRCGQSSWTVQISETNSITFLHSLDSSAEGLISHLQTITKPLGGGGSNKVLAEGKQ